MRIRRILLQNFAQFRDLDWELGPGVIGILGPNGGGKSNAANAAYAALTNDYSRFELGKEGCICQQAGEREKSRILLEVEHEGHHYEIVRSLRPNTHSFRELGRKGTKTRTKVAEIEMMIQEGLGVNRALLDNYVFVGQQEMFAFIELRPAERAKHFAHLCQTTWAEKCWEALGAQIELDRGLTAELTDDSDTLLDELGRRRARAKDLAKELTAAKSDVLDPDTVSCLKDVLTDRATYLEAKNDLPVAKETEKNRLAEAKIGTKEVRKQEALIEELESAYSVAELKADAATTQTIGLNRELKQQRRRGELVHKLAATRKAARARPASPKGMKKGDDLTSLIRGRDAAAEEVRRLEHLLEGCSGDVVECPFGLPCEKPVEELSDAREKTERRLPAKRQQLEALDCLRIQFNQFLTARTEYKAWVKSREERLDLLEEQLETIPEVDVGEARKKLAQLEEVLEQRTDLRKELAGMRHGLGSLQESRQRLIGAHVAAKKLRGDLEAKMEVRHVDKAEAEDAHRRLKAHSAAEIEVAGLEAHLCEVRQDIQIYEKSLARLRAGLERCGRAREYIHLLEEARNKLHRDCLPSVVHQAVLEELEEGVNDGLRQFSAPFHVVADPSLTFVGHFENGTVMPAGGFSGGEKVTLALPFRLEVNSMFASQVGMLVLDEPTAWLDSEHVEGVVDVFSRLRGVAQGRGYQIIVITHERALEKVFDQVFEVGLLE